MEKSPKKSNIAFLAYILFFIPLLTDAKNDPSVKFHVKQGLVLFIGWVIAWGVTMIPGIYFIGNLLNVFLLVLMIIGILNALGNKQAPLPLIGKFADKINI